MDMEVDHYAILGLPTSEEGAKQSEKEISKAYRSKPLELHPDKRLNNPDAHVNFQKLKPSYEILRDEKSRKLFDDLLRIKREKIQCHSQQDSKRRKMTSDLEERERTAFTPDPTTKVRDEEARIARKLKEEIARICAMHADKAASAASLLKKEKKKEAVNGRQESAYGGEDGLDKEKVLKVSWEKIGEDYSAQRLRELFETFGEVGDVVIRGSSKKKGSALIVMASKDAAGSLIAATGNVCGHLSNPLLVLPLQPAVAPTFPSAQQPVESDGPKLSNLVGADFQAHEDSVLEKLQKA